MKPTIRTIDIPLQFQDGEPTRFPEKMLAFMFEGVRDKWTLGQWSRVWYHTEIDFDAHRIASGGASVHPYKIHHLVSRKFEVQPGDILRFVIHRGTDDEFQFVPDILCESVQTIAIDTGRDIRILNESKFQKVAPGEAGNLAWNEGYHQGVDSFKSFYYDQIPAEYSDILVIKKLIHWTEKKY